VGAWRTHGTNHGSNAGVYLVTKEVSVRNRTAVVVLIIGVVAGYLVRGTDEPVAAQMTPQGIPLAQGDNVVLVYERHSQDYVPPTKECLVQEVVGAFVRCSPSQGSERTEEWRNLMFVVGISKRVR
jgi:hypothetical protein